MDVVRIAGEDHRAAEPDGVALTKAEPRDRRPAYERHREMGEAEEEAAASRVAGSVRRQGTVQITKARTVWLAVPVFLTPISQPVAVARESVR